MCGIAGIVGPEAAAHQEVLDAMLETIRHRGPDEGGSVVFPRAALGSRRLSIIDLAGGRMPIANEDGTVFVVFNGEIYDHDRHREQLAGRGHVFRTRADTEVLVHAWEEWGDSFLEPLNGMFALALYDRRQDVLVLARDRLGKKPLYYTLRDGRLSFASELKALMADPGLERRVDPRALSLYLSLEYVPAPRTILEGVSKLQPGEMIRFSGGRVRRRTWWRPRFTGPSSSLSFEQAREDLDRRLERAVRRRLVADVPVGVFLSGGIDSSTVAYYASRAQSDVQTFSIGFEEASFDESAHARAVARHLGTRHAEEILSADRTLELLPEVIRILDEPFADASIFPTYLLSRFTRRHLKVVLGGDGGDEIFLGYPTYWAHRLFRWYEKFPRWLIDTVVPRLVDRLPVSVANVSLDFRIRRFTSGRGHPPLNRNLVWLGAFSPDEKARVLGPATRARLVDLEGLEPVVGTLGGNGYKDDLEPILHLDLRNYLAEDILVKVDRASMASSLEVRAPILDYELVEFVLGLPVSYRLRGWTSKRILKDLMRGRIPDAIIDRPKKGFGIPVALWFRGPLRELLCDELAPGKIEREGLFDPAVVGRMVREHLDGVRDHRKGLWTLLMFELWRREYRVEA